MNNRIFIAINLSEEIKKELSSQQDKIEGMFSNIEKGGMVRWTKKENLHITLIFLGYISDQELLEICKITKEIVSNHKSFSIHLNKICYGPPKKMPPRMFWVEGEKSKELGKLKDDLENSLLKSVRFSPENRAYTPHLTLGRIKTWQWKQIEPEERPKVETEISLDFPVESIEIMESQLKRGGPKYAVLESVPLII